MPRALASGRVRATGRILGPGRPLRFVAPLAPLFAFSGFSPLNFYQTAIPGGEPGVATGFGVAALFQVPTLVGFGANTPLADCSNGIAGWIQYVGGTNSLNFSAVNGAGAFATGPQRTFVSSDVGKIFLHIGLHTGASGLLRSYLDRAEVGSSGVACVGYTPAAVRQMFGHSQVFTASPTVSPILAYLTFRGVPTLAQILAYYDAARILGDLPDTMQGVTVTHLWSAKRELAGMPVTTGVPGPTVAIDRITGAAGDAMAKVGAPTMVVIDPSIDGRKTYGAQGWSDSDYLEIASPGGILGAAGGFWFAYRTRLDSPGAPSNQIQVSRTNAASSQGYQSYFTGSGTGLAFLAANGSTFFSAAPYTVPAGLAGQMVTVMCRYTGGTNGTIRQYVEGVELGQTILTGTFAPYAGPMRIGCHSGGAAGNYAQRTSFFELIGGDLALTDAEVAAFWAAAAGSAALPAIPGKSQHRHRLTDDVVASGVEAVPATVLDRIGVDHLTRVGTGLRLAQRVERVWSYETSPIMHAASTWSQSAFYSTPTDILSSQVAWFFSTVISFNTLGALRTIAGDRDGSNTGVGWVLWLTAANALTLTVKNGAGASITAAQITVATADFGKLIHLVATFEASGIKLAARRVQGTNTAIVGYSPASTPTQLGNAPGVTLVPTQDLEIYGATCGRAQITLAEIQANHDASLANEDIVAYPGKSEHLWSFKRSGGGVPATLLDQIGTAHMTLAGSLTAVPRYARAWAA